MRVEPCKHSVPTFGCEGCVEKGKQFAYRKFAKENPTLMCDHCKEPMKISGHGFAGGKWVAIYMCASSKALELVELGIEVDDHDKTLEIK